MVKTASTMLPLGTAAPDFSLPDTAGKKVSLADFAERRRLLVVFMCNHCPYVKHVADGLARVGRGVPAAGRGRGGDQRQRRRTRIPTIRPRRWPKRRSSAATRFPYLYDATQEVAKAYRAACTPDFYVFDRERKLVYRGQMDYSRPRSGVPVTRRRTSARPWTPCWPASRLPPQQRPSLGCNIKWKPGNEPDYFG